MGGRRNVPGLHSRRRVPYHSPWSRSPSSFGRRSRRDGEKIRYTGICVVGCGLASEGVSMTRYVPITTCVG